MNEAINIKIKIFICIVIIPFLLQVIYIGACVKNNIKIELLVFIITIIIGVTINLILKNKINIIGKIFMFVWLIGYYISFFKLSELQFESNISTKIYMFIIAFIPYIVEITYRILFKKSKLQWNDNPINLKQNSFIIFLFILHLLIFIYECKITGIPLLIGSRVESIGAIHVLGEIFLRVSVYISAYNIIIRKKYLYGSIVCYGFLYTVLVMSRSLTIHFILYIIILGFIFGKFSIKKNFILICITLIFFGIMGNIRNGQDFNISEYASMKTNNKIISWIYTYVGPNYDNLALQIEQGDPTNTLSNTLSPIITVLNLEEKISWFNRSYIYIGKLNIGTIYRDYVVDVGKYLSVIIFIITMFIINIIYYSNSKSNIKSILDIVILSEIALCFFTNHFTSSVFWLSIFILYLLDKFFGERNKVML